MKMQSTIYAAGRWVLNSDRDLRTWFGAMSRLSGSHPLCSSNPIVVESSPACERHPAADRRRDRLVAVVLEELRVAALHVAGKWGLGQRRKVQAWIDERLKGEGDYIQGMDEQADIRERAVTLEREHAPRPAK